MATSEQALPRSRSSRLLGFVAAFSGVFAGLALLHGPGPWFTRAHVALGNLLLPASLESGIQLRFAASTSEPWQAVLHAESLGVRAVIEVPIDLRTLIYLPLAAFVALAIATPLESVSAHLRLLARGLLLLEPLLLVLVAVPLLSFLGGTGPVQAFSLGRPALVLLQLVYRALVAPPGMTYALPLLSWWVLLRRQS